VVTLTTGYGARVPPAPQLFDRLLDDAAMFPPGNADAASAIAAHLRYRAGTLDRFVGPLLVHVDRWVEFAVAHAAAGSPAIEVVVIGTAQPPSGVHGVRVGGFERPVPELPLPPTVPGATLACEIQGDDDGFEVLTAIAASENGYVGKLRTGGTTAAAFPSEATVAAVVVKAVHLGAPLKFTAGLHHAVRFRDEQTGFEHHGFVNLLVAVGDALTGAGERDVADVLGRRDGAALADEIATWTDDQAAAVRRAFVSFGCCGVEDPVRDLVDLGLVEPLPATEGGSPR
jgi:hypothetical protein